MFWSFSLASTWLCLLPSTEAPSVLFQWELLLVAEADLQSWKKVKFGRIVNCKSLFRYSKAKNKPIRVHSYILGSGLTQKESRIQRFVSLGGRGFSCYGPDDSHTQEIFSVCKSSGKLKSQITWQIYILGTISDRRNVRNIAILPGFHLICVGTLSLLLLSSPGKNGAKICLAEI